MNGTRITTHTTAERHDDRRFQTPSKRPMRAGEMTRMVLITIVAALLTGILALPFTMPGRAFAGAETALAAADTGPSKRLRTTAHPT